MNAGWVSGPLERDVGKIFPLTVDHLPSVSSPGASPVVTPSPAVAGEGSAGTRPDHRRRRRHHPARGWSVHPMPNPWLTWCVGSDRPGACASPPPLLRGESRALQRWSLCWEQPAHAHRQSSTTTV